MIIMFIDIHVHTRRIPGPKRRGKQAYATPEQLLARYEAIGVKSAVLLPGVNPECAYVPQSNEEVLEIAGKYPGRFIPFCNVDPRAMTNSPDAPLGEILSHYKAEGAKGVGEVCANLPFEHPLVKNLFKHVEAVGLPLTFHIAPQIGGAYGLYDDPGLPQLERALQEFPNLRFLGHSQPFWAEMAPLAQTRDRYGYPKYPIKEEGRVPQLMRRYPNLLGDLSAGSGHNALARDEDYAVRFLNEFQDRLFFGTDICAPDTPTPLVDFLQCLLAEGKISEEVFAKVAYKNAEKLFAEI
ncbi:MAG TPA: amidohydrolase [Firmicutes bacterium]|nr:amidohydrolase [Bacillota bacterium]